MNIRKLLLFLIIFLLWMLVACEPAATEAPPTATSTPDLRTPLALTAKAQTQLAEDAQATANAQATAEMSTATAAAEATASAESVNATATILMQRTETKATSEAKSTETAATRIASTQQAIASATAQAQPMVDLLADLQGQGFLTKSEGKYFEMVDFDQSWAQLQWYQWYPTFFNPSNFVIRVNIAWESASNIANWQDSGCGFVFRDTSLGGNTNHYSVFLLLDGNVELLRAKNDVLRQVQKAYYGKLDLPAGEAEMVLIVEDAWFTVLINGKKTIRVQDTQHASGFLYYTLLSGTNKDFGTRCVMTDVELWEFE